MEDGSIRGESFQILIESFESASNATRRFQFHESEERFDSTVRRRAFDHRKMHIYSTIDRRSFAGRHVTEMVTRIRNGEPL